MKNLLKQDIRFVECNLPYQLYRMATTDGYIEYATVMHGNFGKVFLEKLIKQFENKDYSFVSECDYEYFRKDFMKFQRISFKKNTSN